MLIMMNAGTLFEAVGINPQTARDAGDYVKATVFMMPFHFLSGATRLFLQAVKLPRPPTYVSLVVALLHPVWCYLLLHRFHMGALGAGICASISYGLEFTLLTAYIAVFRPERASSWTPLPLSLARRRLRCVERAQADSNAKAQPGFGDYLRVALPSAILLWTDWWIYEVLTLMAGLCGKTGLAAHTATANLLFIIFTLPNGLSAATSAVVGQAIGSANPVAARSSLKVAASLMLGASGLLALLLFLSHFALARFFSSEANVVSAISGLCLILAIFQVLDGLQAVLEGGLIGLGLQRGASQVKLISMVLLRMGGAYVLVMALHLGVYGIWLAVSLSSLGTVLLYVRILRRCDFNLIASSARRQLVETA